MIEQCVVGAIVKVRNVKEKGTKTEYRDDPCKFVGSFAEGNDYIKEMKKIYWEDDVSFECQPWTMARFAEYMRQQFECINDRLDSHRF